MALQEELERQGDYLFRRRSYLPLALLAVGLSLKIYYEGPGNRASESLLAEMIQSWSLPVGLLGFAIRVFTVGYTPERTSGRNTKKGQVADVLNTTGAYSLTRNPLYLGNYLMWIAVIMTAGQLSFVLLATLAFWIFYERIVYTEEAFLRQRFGRAYLDWTARTPIFLPVRWQYRPPESSFSWKKVARQEKNGLFALCLILCIFDLAGDYAEGEGSVLAERRSILIALSTGLLYLLLRTLKKHTRLLDEEGR